MKLKERWQSFLEALRLQRWPILSNAEQFTTRTKEKARQTVRQKIVRRKPVVVATFNIYVHPIWDASKAEPEGTGSFQP